MFGYGLLVGLFVGVPMGMFVMALCVTSGRNEGYVHTRPDPKYPRPELPVVERMKDD
jgi:hypothetical protein